MRAEYRHGWKGRRAQGRGRSEWRGGKRREGVEACSMVEEGWWWELARERGEAWEGVWGAWRLAGRVTTWLERTEDAGKGQVRVERWEG